MDWFDRDPPIPRGGRSRDAAVSVSFYHLSFRSGSRGGACAGAAHAYITRTEEYDDLEFPGFSGDAAGGVYERLRTARGLTLRDGCGV